MLIAFLSLQLNLVNVKNNLIEWCNILLGVPFHVPYTFISFFFYFIRLAYMSNFADDSIEDNFKKIENYFKNR